MDEDDYLRDFQNTLLREINCCLRNLKAEVPVSHLRKITLESFFPRTKHSLPQGNDKPKNKHEFANPTFKVEIPFPSFTAAVSTATCTFCSNMFTYDKIS